jgi:hypothetical protein
VSLQGIDVPGPETPEGNQPGVELHERLRSQSIETTLTIDPGLHAPGLSQHPQVLGHRRLRQPELALDIAYGALG